MNQEIYDYQLQKYLQEEIYKLPISQQIQLKSIKLCGRRILVPNAGQKAVFILSNGEEAKTFGNTSCKNTFACPRCSAHQMAKYSAQIGLALEELKKQGYFAFMVTFTIPHLNFMTCRETTDILFETYSYYRRTMKQKNYRKVKSGKIGQRTGTASHQFHENCKIEHSVTVCEYTHGKNGWHPHFHAIYWTKHPDKVLQWESKLNAFWLSTAKRITLKYWQKKRIGWTPEYIEHTLNNLYAKSEKDAGLYFSKSNGKLSQSFASEYICGWGANREVTGNYRKMASNEGHRTPYQILESAYNGNNDDRALYIDYCLAVTHKPVHHRVIWSQTGIKKLILTLQRKEKYEEVIKKNEGKYKVLCWFDESQWQSINDRNDCIIANILYLAGKYSYLLFEFLDGLGITYHDATEHPFSELIEEIYNTA